MREYAEYRFVLETLLNYFDNKHWLSAKEVAQYDGCCEKTAKTRYNISGSGIDIAVLAHRKCELAH